MRRSFALLCVLALLIAGCSSSPAIHATHRVRLATGLRWGLVGLADVPTLDPALATDTTSMTLDSLLYGGLVRLDSHLHVRPDGAQRWTISRDGRVYTFFLRHDLRFPDGRRATAADFAGALQRALGVAGAAGPASFYLGSIAQPGGQRQPSTRQIAVLDRTTLRIRLSRPSAHFLAELAFPASYVPDMRQISRYGPAWTDHAAGFGPYFLRAWSHSRSLTLQRNPYYYAGKPSLKTISFHFYDQLPSAIAAYRAGTLDLISGLQAGQTIGQPPDGTRTEPGLALDYLAFNTARAPFNHLDARRAFAAAWQPRLVADAMRGAAFPARRFLPSAFGIAAPPWRPTARPSTYLTLARSAHGKPFPPVILFIPQDQHVHALARELSRRWRKELGVSAPIRQLNSPEYAAVLNARAFDLAIVRWGADYPDPQDFLGTQLGPSADNVTRWSGHVYDRAVLTADSYSPQDPRRIRLFQQAAAIAARKAALLPLDEPAQTAIISPRLAHVSLTALGTIDGDWAKVRLVLS